MLNFAHKKLMISNWKFLKTYAPGDRQRKMLQAQKELFRVIPTIEECRKIWKVTTGIEVIIED